MKHFLRNFLKMELETVVQFNGGLAYYSVSPESHGIYQARLLRYEGCSDRVPPTEVILVKGYRQWSGSYERQDLLNQIGKAIESRARTGNPSENNQV